MTKTQICDAYQSLLRQAYPRVLVKPCTNEWNPYKDECYEAFFIPDSAAGTPYYDNWNKVGGWHDQIEKQRLPQISIIPIYDSQVRENYAHLFPELFGNKSASATATAKRKQPSHTARRGNVKPSRVRAKVS